MNIIEFLDHQVAKNLNGDKSRFSELWQLIPGFSSELRKFNSNSGWLHWSPKSFDGWYCLADTEGKFEVYFQERGKREASQYFLDERTAIAFALDASIFSLK